MGYSKPVLFNLPKDTKELKSIMAKFKKLFGTNPETVRVLTVALAFSAEGIADVEDEGVAAVLDGLPFHYERLDGVPAKAEDKASEGGAVAEALVVAQDALVAKQDELDGVKAELVAVKAEAEATKAELSKALADAEALKAELAKAQATPKAPTPRAPAAPKAPTPPAAE